MAFCMRGCRDISSPRDTMTRGEEAHAAFAEKLANRLLPLVKQVVLQQLGQELDAEFLMGPRRRGDSEVDVAESRTEPLMHPVAALASLGKDPPRVPRVLPELVVPDQLGQDVEIGLDMDNEGQDMPLQHQKSQESGQESEGITRARSGRSSRKKNSIVNMKNIASSFDINLKGADHTHEVTGDNIRTAEAVDLHQKFKDLDQDGSGFVYLDAVVSEDEENDSLLQAVRTAVIALNVSLGDIHEGDTDCMSLETFKVVMLAEHNQLVAKVGGQNAKVILQLRERMVKGRISEQIAKLFSLDSRELNATKNKAQTMSFRMKSRCGNFAEPLVAIVILINALTIGISLDSDPNWTGWDCFETFFTVFFTTELCIKLWFLGFCEFFGGEDWTWNWIDTIIVLLALVDTSITFIDYFTEATIFNFASFTVFRLFRLVRILRIVRLLRLKMFKELSLMLNGVVGGLRTLFWAIVMLLVIVYTLGIILRQIMDPDRHYCSIDKTHHTCSRGEEMIDKFGKLMFHSVPRSMVTMFLCLTEGCNAPDGTPLLWHLWDTHGALLVIGYLLVYVFVTFGIFNLIVGIFVECVLDFARSDAQLRTSRRHQKHIELAHQLRTLLFKICSTNEDIRQRTVSSKGFRNRMNMFMQKVGIVESENHHADDADESHLMMRVTRETFEMALDSDDVQDLLEDLEVSLSSRENLFHILDSDNNGYVAITELIDGIMKLRGPADKGDTVATVLMMRSMQRHVKKFEEAVLHNQREMRRLIQELDVVRAEQDPQRVPSG